MWRVYGTRIILDRRDDGKEIKIILEIQCRFRDAGEGSQQVLQLILQSVERTRQEGQISYGQYTANSPDDDEQICAIISEYAQDLEQCAPNGTLDGNRLIGFIIFIGNLAEASRQECIQAKYFDLFGGLHTRPDVSQVIKLPALWCPAAH